MSEISKSMLEALRSRRSVHEFEPRKLSPSTITELIEDAVHAPNSFNRQAWLFIVIEGALLRQCGELAKAHALATLPEDAPRRFRQLLVDRDYDIFYEAPALVLVCATAADPLARHDCALAAHTLMLSAHARGLGACWIGFAEAWLNTPEARRLLQLPAEALPVAPVIVGRPSAVTASIGRHPPKILWRDAVEE